MQQCLERRQQQHEQRDTFTLGQCLECRRKIRRNGHRQASAVLAELRRSRMIPRQLQHGGITRQLCRPIGQLALALAGFHPLSLPQRVVGILNRQCRQVHGLPLAEAGVEAHQLIDHDLHRPAIGDDMVLGQYQHMILRGQAQQLDPQQRSLAQIEELLGFLLDQTTNRLVCKDFLSQRQVL